MGESKGCKPLCCPGVDRISQLPDDIIDNILIRLPIGDAARTIVLSRKWKNAWISISKLIFDSSFVVHATSITDTLITDIYGILMLHSGPIVGFKLHIEFPVKFSEIDRLFHFLSCKGVQELDVYWTTPAGYILPSHFYSCLQLRCLKLAKCSINPPCNFGGFKNLKSLRLEYLELTNSVLENFISKCPLLENLFINSCHLKESPVIMINTSNLKCFYYIGIGSYFRFTSAPLLKSLAYFGSVPGEDWGRYSYYEGVEKSSLEEFCNALPTLESLLVDSSFLQTLDVRGISSKSTRRPKSLHHLKVLNVFNIRFWDAADVTSLLGLIGSLPNLEKLTIRGGMCRSSDDIDNPFKSLGSDLCNFSCEKLQVVNFFSVGDHDSELDFVKLLLSKSPQLKKMTIYPQESGNNEKQLNMVNTVTQFKRASTAAEIIFWKIF